MSALGIQPYLWVFNGPFGTQNVFYLTLCFHDGSKETFSRTKISIAGTNATLKNVGIYILFWWRKMSNAQLKTYKINRFSTKVAQLKACIFIQFWDMSKNISIIIWLPGPPIQVIKMAICVKVNNFFFFKRKYIQHWWVLEWSQTWR